MSNNSSFGGKLKKVLASMCSFVVGASGVSQAKFNVGDNVSSVFCGDKKYVYYDKGIHLSDDGGQVVAISTGGNPVVFSLGEFKYGKNDVMDCKSKFLVFRTAYGLSFRLQVKLGEKDQTTHNVIDISWENVATLCSYWTSDDRNNLNDVNRKNFLAALGKTDNEINNNENLGKSFLFFFNFVFRLVTIEEKVDFTYDDISEGLKHLFRVSKTSDKFSPPTGMVNDWPNGVPPEGFEFCNYVGGLSYCMPKKEAFLAQLVRKLGESKVKKDLEGQIAFLKNQVSGLQTSLNTLSVGKDVATQMLSNVAGALTGTGFDVDVNVENKNAAAQTGNLVKAYKDLLKDKNDLDAQITSLNDQKNTLNNQINDLNNQITKLEKFRYGTFFGGMAIPTVIGGAGFVAYKAGLFGHQGKKAGKNPDGRPVTKKPMKSPGGRSVTKKPIKGPGGNKITKKGGNPAGKWKGKR